MTQPHARITGALFLLLALPAWAQFKTPPASTSIQQAAHASAPDATPVHMAATRPPGASSSVQILTDTKGANLQPYLDTMLPIVRDEWYAAIHQVVSKPDYRWGTVVAEFVVARDGEMSNPRITESSGEDELDKAVTQALQKAGPLPSFPKAISLNEIFLRFNFQYMGRKAPHRSHH